MFDKAPSVAFETTQAPRERDFFEVYTEIVLYRYFGDYKRRIYGFFIKKLSGEAYLGAIDGCCNLIYGLLGLARSAARYTIKSLNQLLSTGLQALSRFVSFGEFKQPEPPIKLVRVVHPRIAARAARGQAPVMAAPVAPVVVKQPKVVSRKAAEASSMTNNVENLGGSTTSSVRRVFAKTSS